MIRKKLLSLALAVFMLAGCFAMPQSVSAATSYSGLNNVQTYFNRVIGSLARADYYNTDVLASITLSQAVYESGWARYALPIGGKNLFGIKAYNTWSGMVFDPHEATVYKSYDDFLVAKGQAYINTVSAWRAHESWRDSVYSHSELFLTNSRYSSVIGETDYSKVAKALVEAGYCSDNGYAETVVKIIEQYGFTEYDDISPDADGISAIVTDKEIVNLGIGEQYSFSLRTYPEEASPSSVVWASTDSDIARVDDNGVVTGVSHGTALISATLANGREACSLVYVDCNAVVMESDVWVRTSPDINSSNSGKLPRGEAVKIINDNVYYDNSGNSFCYVKGFNTAGNVVTGFCSTEYIYRYTRDVAAISVVKDDITLKVGDTYDIYTVVAPADANDISVSWSSSDKSVATVENGTVKALKNGTASITATASNGVKKEVKVNVASSYASYKGIVTSYSSLTVRSEPSASASSRGSLPFLSEVIVTGEPNGVWLMVTGSTSSGKTITGYVHSAYVRILSADESYTVADADADIKVYSLPDTSSYSYGTLIAGCDCAFINADNGWSFVIGLKNPNNIKAVSGYVYTGTTPVGPNDTTVTASDWYGRTSSSLFVRSGAGTDYSVVGTLEEGSNVVITGNSENGWYRISGSDINGRQISGWSSAEYIICLYEAYVNVTSGSLNIRSEPSTGSTVLTTLAKDTPVTVAGDEQNGWYNVEYTGSSGAVISGWASAQYIKIIGLLPAESEAVSGFGLDDPSLSIENGYLRGVKAGTSASALLASFKGNVTILDASGKALSASSAVGTNCRAVVSEGTEDSESVTVIVNGDVNGDGYITSNDYLLVKRAFLKTHELSGSYLEAALVSGKNSLNIADYVIIKRVCLGTYTLN